jgi:hypothetical protein
MSQRDQDESTRSDASGAQDTDKALQKELHREAGEGSGGVGDVSSNRNVSGSSTWETMMDPPTRESGERGEVM